MLKITGAGVGLEERVLGFLSYVSINNMSIADRAEACATVWIELSKKRIDKQVLCNYEPTFENPATLMRKIVPQTPWQPIEYADYVFVYSSGNLIAGGGLEITENVAHGLKRAFALNSSANVLGNLLLMNIAFNQDALSGVEFLRIEFNEPNYSLYNAIEGKGFKALGLKWHKVFSEFEPMGQLKYNGVQQWTCQAHLPTLIENHVKSLISVKKSVKVYQAGRSDSSLAEQRIV